MKSTNNNKQIVADYYQKMIEKDFTQMEKYLHPDVCLVGPLANLNSKESILESAKKLSDRVRSIEIRAKFSEGPQVMMTYDWIFSAPIGKLRAAVLMELENELIKKIELFFDTKPFESK